MQEEIKILKQEIRDLKENDISIEYRLLELEGKNIIRDQSKKKELGIPESSNSKINEEQEENYINTLNLVTSHKWHTNITLVIKDKTFNMVALIDSGADINCIYEGIIPIQYYKKTTEQVTSANGTNMNIKYKLTNAKICKDKICYKTPFILMKNLNTTMILGTPFLTLLYPFKVTEKGLESEVLGKVICFEFIKPPRTRELNLLKDSVISPIENKKKQINMLNKEIRFKRIEEQLQSSQLQKTIKYFQKRIEDEICELNPTAFWHRKKIYNIITLYKKF